MYKLLSFIIQKIVALSFKFYNGNHLLNEALLKRGLVIHFKNYYTPFVSSDDIAKPLDVERIIPGLRLDFSIQEKFINNLKYENELIAIPDSSENEFTLIQKECSDLAMVNYYME